MQVIDIHTHAFPDALAERAMPHLEQEGNIKGCTDGKIASLLASMDTAGIERSVVCSIATKPDQFEPILAWSRQIASPRLAPFPSVHPASPQAAEQVRRIAEAGFRGVKLHPYYQDFDLDSDAAFIIYEEARRRGLAVLIHTGFDMAFARVRRCDPEKILRVTEALPDLVFITTHLGAWEDWDLVERLLIGKPIYMEISFSLPLLGAARARRMLLAHPREYVLFGTDSPWADQKQSIEQLRALQLGEDYERLVFYDNARRTLRLCD